MLKKKICVILLMVIIILGINIEVLGFDLLTNIDQQSLEEDQKLTITLQLSDLQEYTKGINVVSGKLIYDTDIFESVSFKGINNWSCAYNNEEGNSSEGKFLLMTTAGNVKEDKEVAQIEFKLNPNLDKKDTTIKIEGIETSHNSEKIKAEDKQINLVLNGNEINIVDEVTKNSNNLEEDNNNVNLEEKEVKTYSTYSLIAIVIISIVVIIMIITIIKLRKEVK